MCKKFYVSLYPLKESTYNFMKQKKSSGNKYKEEFLEALSETFKAYNEYGARSNKKLLPVHQWIAKTIQNKLGNKFQVTSLGYGGEYRLEGKYYPKTLDITVKSNNKPISTISLKFITSNYKQNANNYFENLLGETANIRRVNIGFAHLLVLRAHTPYYDKNKGNLRGNLKKTEILTQYDLSKYVKLFLDDDFPHKPDVLGILVVDFDHKGNCDFANLNELLSNSNKEHNEHSSSIIRYLNEDLSLDKFIEKFIALCKLKA